MDDPQLEPQVRKLIALITLMLLPTVAMAQTMGAAQGFANSTASGGGGSVPTGCSIAAGVLTCTGFVGTSTITAGTFVTDHVGNATTPPLSLGSKAGMYVPLWDTTKEVRIGFTATGITNGSASPSNEFIYFDATDEPGFTNNAIVIDAANGSLSSGPLIMEVNGLDDDSNIIDISQSAVIYGYDQLIIGSRTGALRFFAGGNALANEYWNISSTGVLKSIQTGLSIDVLEGVAPSGAANHDILYADSTAHRFVMNNNNGGAKNVVASGVDINTSDQVTATHLAAALPVAQGGTNLTASADDNVMVGNGTTWETKAVPNCTDTGGNHLNYTAASNAFSCGTSGATNKQFFFFSTGSSNFSATTPFYYPYQGQTAGSSSNSSLGAPITGAGTLKNLVCTVSAAQTSTKTITTTTNASSSLSCVINSSSTCPLLGSNGFGTTTGQCCQDITHTYSTIAGDSTGYAVTLANSPNAGVFACTIEFDPS